MTDIDCPRAKTWMTPCIARDGHLALADDGLCVGCNWRPREALKDLERRELPDGLDATVGNALASAADDDALADLLTEAVKAYADAKEA